MKKLICGLFLIAGIAQAQEPDTNELLCYALALEMLGSKHVTQDQAQAWMYLDCKAYEDRIAPAVAAYLGSKEMGDRYK